MKKVVSTIRGWIANNGEKIGGVISHGQAIGHSVQKRKLFANFVGEGKTKVLFVCAIHGNEVGTAKLGSSLGKFIERQRFPFKCSIIQIANPDGFSKAIINPDYSNGGAIGRLNANNVDLNRNFPVKSFRKNSLWHFGKKKVQVFCGKTGGSEPEVQAITNFIIKNGITIVFSFHNSGKNVVSSNNPDAKKLAKLFSESSGYKLLTEEEWIKYGQTGTFKEWCEDNGVIFIEVEGSNRYRSDSRTILPAIASTLKSLL